MLLGLLPLAGTVLCGLLFYVGYKNPDIELSILDGIGLVLGALFSTVLGFGLIRWGWLLLREMSERKPESNEGRMIHF